MKKLILLISLSPLLASAHQPAESLPSHLLNVPSEVFHMIFNFIDSRDVGIIAQTCKYLRFISQDFQYIQMQKVLKKIGLDEYDVITNKHRAISPEGKPLLCELAHHPDAPVALVLMKKLLLLGANTEAVSTSSEPEQYKLTALWHAVEAEHAHHSGYLQRIHLLVEYGADCNKTKQSLRQKSPIFLLQRVSQLATMQPSTDQIEKFKSLEKLFTNINIPQKKRIKLSLTKSEEAC